MRHRTILRHRHHTSTEAVHQTMKTPRMQIQMTLAGWLILTAIIAVNFWLFRQGIFWGILGISFTKHIGIAYLCHRLGVDKDVSLESR